MEYPLSKSHQSCFLFRFRKKSQLLRSLSEKRAALFECFLYTIPAVQEIPNPPKISVTESLFADDLSDPRFLRVIGSGERKNEREGKLTLFQVFCLGSCP